jgi:tRNA nucleotidyltransferase/poly(A) polymerase
VRVTQKLDFPERRLFVRLFGGDAYAVGGAVRDLLRGSPSPDIDILVVRRPLPEIIKRLKPEGRVDLVGKSFGIIKFTTDGRTYDVALPRKDLPTGAGPRTHRDFAVSFDSRLPLEKDLERRDFRCNSMALRLRDGTLVDPFEGRRDVAEKTIRLTNPEAFPEDPLRVLRAARFASILGFRVDPAIYEASKAIPLAGLSVERTTEELFKILLHSDRPSLGLEEMFRLGALEKLFPELYALTLVIQDAIFHPEKDAYGHHTVWQHTKLSVDQAAALAGVVSLSPARKLALLLSALYHDVGKATTTRWEFKRGRMVITSIGHDVVSGRIAKRALSRMKIFSWNGLALGKMAPLLIGTHHRASELWTNRASVTKKAFNRLAAEVDGEIELVVLLDAADRAGRKTRILRKLDRQALWLFKKFEELRVNRETIRPLVMGRDLIQMGVEPGPEMGKILKRIYRLQLDGAFETKGGGLERARKIVGGGKG